MEHQDFGEKIGGARKDLRGSFTAQDISALTHIERSKLVRKEMVWPVPNYLAMVEQEGYDRKAVALIKDIRDSFPPAPIYRHMEGEPAPEKYHEACLVYIDMLNAARAVIMGCKTKEEVSEKLSKDSRITEQFGTFSTAPGYNGRPRSTLKFSDKLETMPYQAGSDISKALNNGISGIQSRKTDLLFWRNPDWPAGASRVDSILRKERAAIVPSPTGTGWVLGYGGSPVREDTYPYYRRSRVTGALCGMTFNTPEEGEALLRDTVAASRKKSGQSRKEKFAAILGEDLDLDTDVFRIGQPNLTAPARGENYLHDFNLRGGEFGNWVNQGQRQELLDRGYESFCDLAEVMKMEKGGIGLGGRLAIAFGARGTGGKRAASAHYEPGRQVINLTKPRGSGSLAHEWAHAMDHYLGNRGREIGLTIPLLDGGWALSSADTATLTCSAVNPEHQDEAKRIIEVNRAMQTIWRLPENPSQAAIKERALANRDAALDGFADRVENMIARCQVALERKNSDPATLAKRAQYCAGMLSTVNDPEFIQRPEFRIGIIHEALLSELSPDKETPQAIADELTQMSRVVREFQGQFNRANEPGPNRGKSNYFVACAKLDREMGYEKGYFSLKREMFARAFEACVEESLQADGRLNMFLVKPTNSQAYPQGDERTRNLSTLLPALREVAKDIKLPERQELETAGTPAPVDQSYAVPGSQPTKEVAIQELFELFSNLPEKKSIGMER